MIFRHFSFFNWRFSTPWFDRREIDRLKLKHFLQIFISLRIRSFRNRSHSAGLAAPSAKRRNLRRIHAQTELKISLFTRLFSDIWPSQMCRKICFFWQTRSLPSSITTNTLASTVHSWYSSRTLLLNFWNVNIDFLTDFFGFFVVDILQNFDHISHLPDASHYS